MDILQYPNILQYPDLPNINYFIRNTSTCISQVYLEESNVFPSEDVVPSYCVSFPYFILYRGAFSLVSVC